MKKNMMIVLLVLFACVYAPTNVEAEGVSTNVVLRYDAEEGKDRCAMNVYWRVDDWSTGLELSHSPSDDFFSVRPILTYSWKHFSTTLGTSVSSLDTKNISVGGSVFGSVRALRLSLSGTYYRGTDGESSDFLDIFFQGQLVLNSIFSIGLEAFDDYFLDLDENVFVIRPFIQFSLNSLIKGASLRVAPFYGWMIDDEGVGLRTQVSLNF